MAAVGKGDSTVGSDAGAVAKVSQSEHHLSVILATTGHNKPGAPDHCSAAKLTQKGQSSGPAAH